MEFPRTHPRRNSIARRPRSIRLLAAASLLLSFSLSASAKEPLVGIVIFDSASGPSYVQVAAVTINGKTDLRSCDGVA